MNEIKDGGPAFPVAEQQGPNGEQIAWAESGMTLRDYFAAKAMQAIVEDPQWRTGAIKVTAEIAYEMADAMLRARTARSQS